MNNYINLYTGAQTASVQEHMLHRTDAVRFCDFFKTLIPFRRQKILTDRCSSLRYYFLLQNATFPRYYGLFIKISIFFKQPYHSVFQT